MSFAKCSCCGEDLEDRKDAREHYQSEHSGEIETPDEYLPDTESEQRDFEGETPDESEHNPEYLTEIESPDTGRIPSLNEFERGEKALQEYNEETEDSDND